MAHSIERAEILFIMCLISPAQFLARRKPTVPKLSAQDID